jgi:hypothetical protein
MTTATKQFIISFPLIKKLYKSTRSGKTFFELAKRDGNPGYKAKGKKDINLSQHVDQILYGA